MIAVLIHMLSTSRITGQSIVYLNPSGYNYNANMNVQGDNVKAIIDTGNPFYTILNTSTIFVVNNTEAKSSYCLYLLEDGTMVSFAKANQNVMACSTHNGQVGFGNSTGVVANYTVAFQLQSQNRLLHNWFSSTGDIGLAYCEINSELCALTVFQQLLINSTAGLYGTVETYPGSTILNSSKPLHFGLDLNGPDIISGSTLQLGLVSSAYSKNLSWFQQATVQPAYHTFFLENFNFCGVNLLTNWSMTWPVIVDTGSVCLTLPAEIYDTFFAWLNSSAVSNAEDLPAFSFRVNGADSEQLYIPLSNLLLNSSDILTEPGAPKIFIGGQSDRLCVLKGSSIGSTSSNYNTPLIVFGTLTLRSLYFAADFSNGSMALASKLSDKQESTYANEASAHCKSKVLCQGDQKFEYSTNTCTEPSCAHYFFVYVDETTNKCQYHDSALAWGLMILLIVVIAEVMSYFIFQHTASEYMIRSHGVQSTADSGPSYYKLDPITQFFGECLAGVVDFFLIHILRWARNRH